MAARTMLTAIAVFVAASPAWGLGPKSGQPPKGSVNEESRQDALIERVGIDQKLGAQVPLGLRFTTAEGKDIALGDLIGERPVVLVLAYYECPMLCTLVLNGLLRAMNVLETFDVGREYDVLTVSIDPRETAALAADKKAGYLGRYRREGAAEGWHFLVGEQEPVTALAEAVGFRYVYDEATDQFAHGSAVMVLTPGGKVSKYHFGQEFSPFDLRMSLVEAAKTRIGGLSDVVLFLCFQYNPLDGTYSFAIMRFLRVVGVLTVIGILAFIGFSLRRDRVARSARGEFS